MPLPNELDISTATEVLAVYVINFSKYLPPGDLIIAVWGDGTVIWSKDRLDGGPPWFQGDVEPDRVRKALDRLEQDGLFANLHLKDYGISSASHQGICVRNRGQTFDMLSAHEKFESTGKLVAESTGITSVRKRPPRLQILSEQPASWRFSRMVWLELRALIDHLTPREGNAVAGHLEFGKAMRLSWIYRPLIAERGDTAEPSSSE